MFSAPPLSIQKAQLLLSLGTIIACFGSFAMYLGGAVVAILYQCGVPSETCQADLSQLNALLYCGLLSFPVWSLGASFNTAMAYYQVEQNRVYRTLGFITVPLFAVFEYGVVLLLKFQWHPIGLLFLMLFYLQALLCLRLAQESPTHDIPRPRPSEQLKKITVEQ